MHRNRVITFRVSDEELADLRRWAALNGMGLSEYLRSKARPPYSVTGASAATVTFRAS